MVVLYTENEYEEDFEDTDTDGKKDSGTGKFDRKLMAGQMVGQVIWVSQWYYDHHINCR